MTRFTGVLSAALFVSNVVVFFSGGGVRRQAVLWGLMESHKTPLTPLY